MSLSFPKATKQLHKLLQDVGIEIVVGESFTENPANQLANIKVKRLLLSF